jgi:hypothetical protein
MAEVIRKDEPNPKLWERLHKTWIAERKPGYVMLGGQSYRVLHPDEDNIAFVPQGGFDDSYGSQSRGL